MPKSKSHYETLGVDKKASKEEIKKAYRRKAVKAHPDRGGDAKEMTALAIAYKVLSDDKKREYYDETGQSSEVGIEQEVRNGVLAWFNNAFINDAKDVVGYCRMGVEREIEMIEEKLYDGEKAKKKTEDRRGKIKLKEGEGKEGVNLAEVILEQQLRNVDEVLEKERKRKLVFEGMLKELEKYEQEGVKEEGIRGEGRTNMFLGYGDFVARNNVKGKIG